ncbi:hypothetical protein Trydic_g1175 [Trypoxylus dichotomus]
MGDARIEAQNPVFDMDSDELTTNVAFDNKAHGKEALDSIIVVAAVPSLLAVTRRLQNCIGFLGKHVKLLLGVEKRVTLKLKGADRRSVTSVAVASCQAKKTCMK